MAETEPLDPLRLLQDDLKDDDYEQAIHSVRRLTTIALALGPERTRNELVPFLLQYCEQDNDEAHAGVAQQLGLMCDLVGGAAHIPTLLTVLEKLAGEEECVVRDAAVKSLQQLAGQCTKAVTKDSILPLVRRLAGGDWFTMRVSACWLFSCSYALCEPAGQEELRAMFVTLCSDDTPMVRKAAFKNLGPFSTAVGPACFKQELLPILTKISQDDVDSMRVHAISACTDLALTLDSAEYQASVFPIIEALQDDASWKVRKGLADTMPTLCTNIGAENASKLLPIFARLLKDKEAEVRAVSTKSLAPISALCKEGMMESVAPVLANLATDQNQGVRVELSKSMGELFRNFGKDVAQKLLLPMLQQLAQDEAFEVRNSIISELDKVTETLGPTAVGTAILPVLIELSKDQKWRVRMAVVEKAAFVAEHLGQAKFEKKLQKIVIDCLSDHVYTIREKCCEQIGLIVKLFGGRWAAEKLFPEAFKIYDKTTNYLHRMTCLLIIMNCAQVAGAEVVESSLLRYIVAAAKDEVPNVRLAAAKAMIDVVGVLDDAVYKAKLVPLLTELMADGDSDVVFFSRAARNKFNNGAK